MNLSYLTYSEFLEFKNLCLHQIWEILIIITSNISFLIISLSLLLTVPFFAYQTLSHCSEIPQALLIFSISSPLFFFRLDNFWYLFSNHWLLFIISIMQCSLVNKFFKNIFQIEISIFKYFSSQKRKRLISILRCLYFCLLWAMFICIIEYYCNSCFWLIV